MPAVPVVTGPGQVTLVVRNALGREQVITTAFYASSRLLKQGLNDYSFSVGKLRENYGLDSSDYGYFAATGLFRHGFTPHFTGEVHGEFSNTVRDVSLGATFADTYTGVVSHSALGSGVLGRFGLQRQWRNFSLGGNVQLASPRFTELGYIGLPAPRLGRPGPCMPPVSTRPVRCSGTPAWSRRVIRSVLRASVFSMSMPFIP